MSEHIDKATPLSLENVLSDLNREQLQTLLLKLSEQEPSLTEAIMKQVALLSASSSQPTTPHPLVASKSPRPQIEVNSEQIRRQVGNIVHSVAHMSGTAAYYQVGSVVHSIEQFIDQAWTWIDADDGRQAITILEAITEEYINEWESLDDSDGDAGELFNTLGQAWTEAILSADLTSKERKHWANQLATWQRELDNYGIDEAFDAPQTAALDGWDYPALKRVFQGIITEQGAWDGEAPYNAENITSARLHILERRGQWQEYLYLAEAEGHTAEYVTMLVRLGRAEEAFSYGQKYLATTDEALALAKALYDHGEREQGLQIAERGLNLEGYKSALAKWLRDQALLMGERTRALAAAEIAFREEISLENYLQVARIAGAQWNELRSSLLEYLRSKNGYSQYGKIDILLHEGLLDDAIASLDDYSGHTLIGQVVDAALKSQSHFDWVIDASRKQAESIMDAGKSKYYSSVATWLSKARTAYHATGREKEWKSYLSELLALHSRKYSLVPMLKALQ